MVYAILLVSSTLVLVDSNMTTVHFLLMEANVSNRDSSSVVPAVDRVLEEINMKFNFKMKYKFSDDEVRNTLNLYYNETCHIVQCNKSSTVLLS